MTVKRKKDKITPVRFDTATYAELLKRASAEDRSVSYIVRQAVVEYFKKERKP